MKLLASEQERAGESCHAGKTERKEGYVNMKHLNRWVYAAVGVIVLVFAGLIYAWSVLSTPVAAEFTEWTKAQLSLTFTIAMACFCLGGLAGGLLSGKISVKINVWAAAVMFLAGFLLAGRAQSLGMLYLGFGFLGGFASGLAYNAVMSTMSKWFPDKQGLISGILLMGFGIGSFVIGKIYTALTPQRIGGWRSSFAVFAILLFMVMIVSGFFFEKPGADFMVPAAVKKKDKKNQIEGIDVDASVMLRRPSFWLYFAWAVLLSAAGLALIAQASGVVGEVAPALEPGTVATVVGLISVFNGIGRVLFGGLFDKVGCRKTMMMINGCFFVSVIVVIAGLVCQNFAVLVVSFICFGISYGGITPTNSAFVNAFYGPANYPVNFSMINLNLIVASFGGTLAGALYDRSGSYLGTFVVMIGAIAVGTMCSAMIKRP